jgi:trans-aconitate methyltransferase
MQWDAKLYQQSHGFVAEYGKSLLEFIPEESGFRILDIGCGTGVLTAGLAKRCVEVVGIDASPMMVDAAKAGFPALDLRVMDALSMTFEKPFDVAFSNAVFHWISNQNTLLQNIRDVLKPGGLLICEFGAKGNIHRIQSAYANAAAKLGKPYESSFYFPSAEEYGALLQSFGFVVEHLVEFDRPTKLSGGEKGLYNWIWQFFAGDLGRFSQTEQETLLFEVEFELKGSLWDGDQWVADYRRIQAVAKRG